ncbi:MAG: GNAT family N-acetyltransferase [Alphaproteobacteria bacterium]|nr:GNAT family N-acetyltransferase [Alphaproteobacteria bacterium]
MSRSIVIEVVEASALDLEEVAGLQRACFGGVEGTSLLAAELKRLQAVAGYRRRYWSPAGLARIAMVRDSGRLVAMAAMVPTTIRHPGGTATAWQNCDVATLPEARGRGYHGQCLDALIGALPPGDVFFGFPNANAVAGFARNGGPLIADLSLHVMPMPRILAAPDAKAVARFDRRQDDLALRLIGPKTTMIEKSARYLNWRYFDSIPGAYAAYMVERDGIAEGFVVIRALRVGWVRLGVIMELFATTADTELRLLAAARYWAFQQGCWASLAGTSRWSKTFALRACAIPIPRRMAVRPLPLMGRTIDPNPANAWLANWHSHLGDWDVL